MSTLIAMAGRVSRSFSSKAAMAALLLMGFLVLSAIHGHAASPDPGTVKIYSLTYHGSICPSGSSESEVSDDGQSLTLKFAQFNASGISRKTCMVTLTLSYPAGLRFRLVDVTMRGHAELEDGVTAKIHTKYHTFKDSFNGRSWSGTALCAITRTGSFNCMDDFDEPLKVPMYGHCNRDTDLTILNEPRFNGEGHLFDITQIFAIAWESC